MAEKKRKKTSLGWFFWLAFILLVALLFFINKNNIKSVLEKTNAKSVFKKSEETKEEQKEVDISVIQNEIEKINSDSSDKDSSENSSTEKKSAKKKKTEKKKVASSKKDKEKKKTKSKDSKKEKKADKKKSKDSKKKTKEQKKTQVKKSKNKNSKTTAKKPANSSPTMNAKMYFISIGSDGQIMRKALTRKVRKTDSPMSNVLKTLLRGPSLAESKKGYRTFIPPNTRLLSATVKDGIAILNLSEEFQFNQYGIEAYQEQLAQIVLTACEFPTVTSVQFLIEGERKNYLGGEGVWIGSPLTPASF